MPHFINDCSENILAQKNAQDIMQAVYETAEASKLFALNDIKVRINPYQHFKLGADKRDFIHAFGYIMEGRTKEQKASLSKSIIQSLNNMFPTISILSMNVYDFEMATYSNKSLIDPLNTTANRHF